jgi:hypothetical protein
MLVMLLAIAPLLTCLPSPVMTDAEMACCKKMFGNCDMGVSNHSCCKTAVSVSQSMVVLAQRQQAHVPHVLVAVPILLADAKADFASEDFGVTPSPIPISPPGSQSILRI